MPGDVESSSAPQSSATGRITVAGYSLEVGDSAGSKLAPASTQGDSTASAPAPVSTKDGSRALRRALARRGRRERPTPSEKFETAVESASEVTSKLEHAMTLFREFVSGDLDVDSLSDEADALFAMLQRLDGAKRWEDVLRVARCLALLAALVGRWIELVRSLRLAIQAAEQFKSPLGEAWAEHELGTLNLVAGRHADADRHLGEARQIRERLGNRRELAATNNNLQVLCQTLRGLAPRRRVERVLDQLARTPALALIAAVTLFVVGGVGGTVLARSGGPQPAPQAALALSFVPSAPHAGQSIVFSATASDAQDPAASYTWQWGDGDPAAARVQRHAYRAAGRYRVVLTARDARGRVIGTIAHYVVIQRRRRNTLTQKAAVTTEPEPEPRPTAVILHCPASRSLLGEAVDASGSITPARSGTTVEVIYVSPSGEATTDTPTSDAQGSYETSFVPEESGSWTVRSSQARSSGYQASTSKSCAFTVAKSQKVTTTTITCPAGSSPLGEAVGVSGSITPARAGATVKVIYHSPSGTETPLTPTSNAEGFYNTSFTPEEEGSWTVQSSQPESSSYESSTSNSCAFSVERSELR